MPTPDSSSTAYADPGDLKTRYDVRVLGDLAGDNGVRLTPSQLDSSTRVLKALLSASGLVESAVTVGGAYGVDDLQALTGASLEFLKDLVCDLAMGRLWLARPDPKWELPKSYEVALEALEALRRGERVLGLVAQKEAGTGVSVTVESAQSVEERNMLTKEAGRFFSTRNNRLHG